MLNRQILVLILLVFVSEAMYNQKPDHTVQYSNVTSLPQIYLSPDEQKIAVALLGITTDLQLYGFNGAQICNQSLSPTQVPMLVFWPLKQGLLYYNNSQFFVLKNSTCNETQVVVNTTQQASNIKGLNTESASYVLWTTGAGKMIQEYDITNKNQTFAFEIFQNNTLKQLFYSPDRSYIYGHLSYLDGSQIKTKVVAVNPNNQTEQFQILTPFTPMRVLHGGQSFYGYNDTLLSGIFKVNKTGYPELIYTPDQSQLGYEVCSKDDLIVILKANNQTSECSFHIYDSNGKQVQKTVLDFIPFPSDLVVLKIKTISCNDKQLAINGIDSKVRIFNIKKGSDDEGLATWAIILISVVLFVVVAGIVGFVIHKKKKSSQSGYEKFDKEEKSNNGI